MAGLWMVRTTVIDQTDPEPLNNPNIGVFGYRSNLTLLNEESALWAAFDANIRPTMAAILHEDAQISDISVFELNGTRFFIQSPSSGQVGLRTGDKMPRFVSWGFRLNRAQRGVHHGAKRVGPISETDVTDGIANGGVATALTAFATSYGAGLYDGAILTWFPVILERPDPAVPNDIWRDHPSNGATYVRVTTQNSRKR